MSKKKFLIMVCTRMICCPFSSDFATQVSAGILAIACSISADIALEIGAAHENWVSESLVDSSIVLGIVMFINFFIWSIRVCNSMNDQKFSSIPILDRACRITSAELAGCILGLGVGLLFDALIEFQLGHEKIEGFIGELFTPFVIASARGLTRYGIFKAFESGRALKKENHSQLPSEISALV